ncbi:ArnT family glycosyltransferase [Cerasicoccus frondis]|uniref:ArnT family glycosyltransferase n=1 Tax=Cerasicoccus frondis TaxID=490090 RepID=UPI0028527355|nr:hypothetical protein [Cerasicoccus frondis]
MQRFVHWLEEGRGDTLLRIITATLFVILCSFYLSGKRYLGPNNERVLETAVLAQSIADGKGFTTPVWHPQAVRLMEVRNGWTFSTDATLPDLYTAPGYPLVVGLALKALPDDFRAWLEDEPNRTYYLADFFLLAVSLFFFWANLALIAVLTKQIFGARAAWLAVAGYLVSAGVWDGVFSVNCGMMLSFLCLLLMLVALGFERSSGPKAWLWPVLAGLLCGALFLTDYPAGLILGPVGLYFAIRFWLRSSKPHRWLAALGSLILVGLCFAAVTTPWLMHNLELTGNPLALAGQQIGWKAGDPTAEPENFRQQFHPSTAPIQLRKLINKGLDGMGSALRGDLWQGGGLLFVGFFLASLFYQFQRGSTNALRWLALALIAAVTIGGPFLDSGESPIVPGYWLAPLFIIFGAGFFFVMMESAHGISPWKKRIWIGAVLLLQALPVLHWVLQPGVRGHFSFPPYAPTVFRALKVGMVEKFYPGYGVMSDSPAGLAWYGQITTWGQPNQMREFAAIIERQPMGALVLTPNRLDQPFYAELLRSDGATPTKDAAWSYGWGALYHGLAAGRTPAFFPLQKPVRIWDNIYVCLDTRAYPPGSIR